MLDRKLRCKLAGQKKVAGHGARRLKLVHSLTYECLELSLRTQEERTSVHIVEAGVGQTRTIVRQAVRRGIHASRGSRLAYRVQVGAGRVAGGRTRDRGS